MLGRMDALEWRSSHDVGCFIKPPTIQAVQRWQANTWDVYFDFELRWDLDEELAGITNVPSLSLR